MVVKMANKFDGLYEETVVQALVGERERETGDRYKEVPDVDIYRGRAMPSSDTKATSSNHGARPGPTTHGKGSALAQPRYRSYPLASPSSMGPVSHCACHNYGLAQKSVKQKTRSRYGDGDNPVFFF